MGKLVPILLVLIGIGAGAGAGFYLRPPTPEPQGGDEQTRAPMPAPKPEGLALYEFSNQFMVPLVVGGSVTATIVLRLALEYAEAEQQLVATNAPRLRDAFLQVMFDYANTGGFDGSFTDNAALARLRRALLESAQKIVGPQVAHAVLITELLRAGS